MVERRTAVRSQRSRTRLLGVGGIVAAVVIALAPAAAHADDVIVDQSAPAPTTIVAQSAPAPTTIVDQSAPAPTTIVAQSAPAPRPGRPGGTTSAASTGAVEVASLAPASPDTTLPVPVTSVVHQSAPPVPTVATTAPPSTVASRAGSPVTTTIVASMGPVPRAADDELPDAGSTGTLAAVAAVVLLAGLSLLAAAHRRS